MQPHANQQNQNHVAKEAIAGTPPEPGKKLQCTVTIAKDGDSLMGYACEDGTFQFLIDGNLREFETIPDVWSAWARLA